jgi:hypothetical protein
MSDQLPTDAQCLRYVQALNAQASRTEHEQQAYAEAMFPHYVECALWSSNDPETEQPLDDVADIGDLAPETQASMREDIAAFVREAGELLDDVTPEMAGHDFWLTRNRHGAGFWDRGLGATGERLSSMAHAYGSVYLWLDADGVVQAG